jgi:Predicted membrane protein
MIMQNAINAFASERVMDWWKLFGGTFILIFLAELGDKTQLAAMARAADGPDGVSAKWVVFLAASAALVFSTLIAVFFGGVLRSLVPDERYIKIAAGILFLVFGALILMGVARSYMNEGKAAPPEAAPAAAVSAGYLGEVALPSRA